MEDAILTEVCEAVVSAGGRVIIEWAILYFVFIYSQTPSNSRLNIFYKNPGCNLSTETRPETKGQLGAILQTKKTPPAGCVTCAPR
jgi:hypothetical protein